MQIKICFTTLISFSSLSRNNMWTTGGRKFNFTTEIVLIVLAIKYRVSKKRGICVLMLSSMVGPVKAIGCTVGTQTTLPVVPRHTLGSYITFCAH